MSKKWQGILIFTIGLWIIVISIYAYYELSDVNSDFYPTRLKWLTDVIGKKALSGFFVLIGIIQVIVGVRMIKKN